MATTSSSSVRPALRVVPTPVTPLPSRSGRDAHAPPAEADPGAGDDASPPPTVSPLARLGIDRHPSSGRAPGAAAGGRAADDVPDPVDLALRRLQRALDTGTGEVDRLMARPGRRRRRGPTVRIIGGGAA